MSDYEKALCLKCNTITDDITPHIEEDFSVTFICNDCAKKESMKVKKTYDLKQELSILKAELSFNRKERVCLEFENGQLRKSETFLRKLNDGLEYEKEKFQIDVYSLESEILRLKKALVLGFNI